MGTWISHLRVAESLLTELPGLDEAAFTIGNLAPDSGIPNADWSAFDPPKEVTHFLRPGEDEGRCADLQFFRQYLEPLSPNDDRARYSFVLGYFFHLLCDNLWAKLIVSTSKRAYAKLFTEKKEAIWTVKRDWYDLDHRYVRCHPEGLFWRVLISTPNPPMYLPFISEAGLYYSLDYIRNFYSEEKERDLDRTYPYLNETTMTRFVTDSVSALLKIHGDLQKMSIPANTQTALSLLTPKEIRPYEPPLGDIAW